MSSRLSLADKISTIIIALGIISILLIYYISESYKQLAHQHHTQAIQQFAYLETEDLIEDLKANSQDLALVIEKNNNFKHAFKYKYEKDLTQILDNQFYQYFVTAGVTKLLKLYVLDTDFTLISTSTEGIETNTDGELICPELSQSALDRHGSEKLQTLSRTCLYKRHPVFAMIVPFGGLDPKGYIQIVTDLAYNLQKIDQSMTMPIQIELLDRQSIYQSKDWHKTNDDFLQIMLPFNSSDNKVILKISLKSDMSGFNRDIKEYRNLAMFLAFTSTALAILIVIWLLQYSATPPLVKIHDILEKIHLPPSSDDSGNRLLFAQLLEQIILLRKKQKTSFSVMMLDIDNFEKINIEYGEKTGDQLLLEIERRLSSILRESDMISWVGTDMPGHKLLPSDSQTKYHATIARLGGDEFGILLPSAHTEKQALNAAQRIVGMFDKAFEVNNYSIEIECKIGISIYPRDGEDEKLLIRNADKAMLFARAEKLNISSYHEQSLSATDSAG